MYNAHPQFLCTLYIRLLHPRYVVIMPMYDAHPYFSLRHLGKKCALNTAKYGNTECKLQMKI